MNLRIWRLLLRHGRYLQDCSLGIHTGTTFSEQVTRKKEKNDNNTQSCRTAHPSLIKSLELLAQITGDCLRDSRRRSETLPNCRVRIQIS